MTDTMRGFEVNTREAKKDEVNTLYDTQMKSTRVKRASITTYSIPDLFVVAPRRCLSQLNLFGC